MCSTASPPILPATEAVVGITSGEKRKTKSNFQSNVAAVDVVVNAKSVEIIQETNMCSAIQLPVNLK